MRVIRLENLSNLTFVADKHTYVSKEKFAALKKHTVVPGDILVGSFVDGAVRVCVLPELPTPAIAKADCFCLRTRSDIADRKFVALQLGTHRTRDALIEDIHGATRPRITTRQLRDFEVRLPPLAEQRRIVAKVEALLKQVDRAKERLVKVPRILKRFRQLVLAAACSGKLTKEWRARTPVEALEHTLKRVHFEQTATGREATENAIPGVCVLAVGNPEAETPTGWQWLPIMDVARLESGHTPSRKHEEYWDGDTPWISLPDARDHHGGVINQTRSGVTAKGLANSAARLLPRGTVCLSRTASVGYVVQMGRPMATSQDFVNWVCSDALAPDFLMYALMAEGDHIREFGRGTTHTTIYFPEVKAMHICLPPVAEQLEIVRVIRGALPVADAIEHRVQTAAARVEKLPQSILAKAFSGELVPTEAELARAEEREYESASALLARLGNAVVGDARRSS